MGEVMENTTGLILCGFKKCPRCRFSERDTVGCCDDITEIVIMDNGMCRHAFGLKKVEVDNND